MKQTGVGPECLGDFGEFTVRVTQFTFNHVSEPFSYSSHFHTKTILQEINLSS
jgi:hypothetical protein